MGRVDQKRTSPDPATFIGKGKLYEMKALISNLDTSLVVCNDSLLPTQLHNIGAILGVEVWDRPFVIMKIFEARAYSAEAKLQVELASVSYTHLDVYKRQLDKGELWRHSLGVAYLSRYIGEKVGGIDLEEAYLAGLLHDIGKIVLNEYVRYGYSVINKMVEEKSIPFTYAEREVLGFDHAEICLLYTSRCV